MMKFYLIMVSLGIFCSGVCLAWAQDGKIPESTNGDIVLELPKMSSNSAYGRTAKFLEMSSVKDAASFSNGKESKLAVSHKDIIEEMERFAKARDVSIKRGKFSPISVKSKIDEGLPILARLLVPEPEFEEIVKRSQSRPSGDEAQALVDYIKNNKIKESRGKNAERYSMIVIICGYNKTSKEYALDYYANKKTWFTENEMKDYSYELYFPNPKPQPKK